MEFAGNTMSLLRAYRGPCLYILLLGLTVFVLAPTAVFAAATKYYNDCSANIVWSSAYDESGAGSPTWNSSSGSITAYHGSGSGSSNSNRTIVVTGLRTGQPHTVSLKVRIDSNGGYYWFEVGAKAGEYAASVTNGWGTSDNMFAKWDAWNGFLGSTTNGNWVTVSKTITTDSSGKITLALKHGGYNPQSVYVDDITVVDDTAPATPAAPTGGSATANSSSQITWGWTPVTGLSGETYRVYDAATGGSLKVTSVADASSVPETNLSPNTQYTRWVATFKDVESSTRLALPARYTLANVPSAPTVGGATATTLSVTVNENSNPAATTFAIKCVQGATTKYVQADGTLGTSEVWRTKSQWGTVTVTGLTPNTIYSFSAAAKNGDGTPTDYGTAANGTTLSITPLGPAAGYVEVLDCSSVDRPAYWNGDYGLPGGKFSVATYTLGATSERGGSCVKGNTSGGASYFLTRRVFLKPNTTGKIRVWLAVPKGGSAHWVEAAYKTGDETDFNESAGTWTLIKKFDDWGLGTDNGGVWTEYESNITTDATGRVNVGIKIGGTTATAYWDCFSVSENLVDLVPPSVTVNQAAGQADPTTAQPVNFTVTFSEPVTGFDATDIVVTGTATGTFTKTITGAGPVYNVAIGGITGSGTVIVSIPAGAAVDVVGNPSTASTSTDNQVTVNLVIPNAPTNPTATNITTNSIRWGWTDSSTDETGFRVFAGAGATAPTTATATTAANVAYWDHSTLTANTQYAFQVAAIGPGGDSAKTSNLAKYTLATAPTFGASGNGKINCASGAGSTTVWYPSGASFDFVAVNGFGTGAAKASKYQYVWNTAAGEPSWTGAAEWTTGNLTRSETTTGSYYLHLRACNGDGAANPATLHLGPYQVDATAPSNATSITESSVSSGAWTNLSTPAFSWSGAADTQSGLQRQWVSFAAADGQAHSLCVNGGFEAGTAAGWTTWRNPNWGSAGTYAYDDTTGSPTGSYDLKMSCPEGSFGVYQQFATVAGQAYRVDGKWKGTGSNDWYEVLLIDGSFSLEAADTGTGVAANIMYKHDSSPYGPMPSAWETLQSLNGTGSDANARSGIRVASGTTMTLVLKCGTSGGGVTGYFDNLALYPVPTTGAWTPPALAADGSEDGELLFNVRAQDNAGNLSGWTTTPVTFVYRYDSRPPTTPGVPADAGNFTGSTSVVFTWAGSTDALSGLAGYEAQVGTSPGGSDVFSGSVGTQLGTTVTGANGVTYYARARALDAAGNVSAWSAASDGITVDTGAPIGTLSIDGGADYANRASVTLNIAASDGVSGVATMRFSDDSSNWTAWEPYGASRAWVLPSGDGVKTVYAQFADAVGNVSAIASDDIVLDSIAPRVVNVTSSNEDGTYGVGEIVHLIVTFTEPVVVGGSPQLLLETGDTDRYAVYTDGSGTDTLTFDYEVQQGDQSPHLDYVSGSALELGTSTIEDSAANGADVTLPDPGQPGSLGANKAIVIQTDTTPPEISISAPSAVLTTGGPVTFTITYSGADSVTLSPADVTLVTQGTAAAGSVSVSGSGLAQRVVSVEGITGDGQIAISIATGTASDAAGNAAPAAGPSDTFDVDNTMPLDFAPTANPAGWTASGTVEISFATSDTGSGVSHYDLAVDTGGYSAATSPYPLSTSALDDGEHTIYVRAVDLAGNARTKQLTVQLDKTAPQSFTPTANPSDWTSQNVTITFSAVDETSGVESYELALGEGAYGIATSPYVVTQEGQSTVHVRAIDRAGNSTNADVVSRIDRTAPVAGVASCDAYVGSAPVRVAYSGAGDLLSGLAEVSLWYKKGQSGIWTDSGLSASAASGSFSFVPAGDDTYYFGLVAKDNAGNSSPSASGDGDCSVVYDTTAPGITIIDVTQDGASLIDQQHPLNALQGLVTIEFSVDEPNLGSAPGVVVVDALGDAITVGQVQSLGGGHYSVDAVVDADTANGAAEVRITVADLADNTASVGTNFSVNKSRASFKLVMTGLDPGVVERWLTFKFGASGATPQVVVRRVVLSAGVADVTLEDIPINADWTRLSIKDRLHSLRTTIDLSDPSGNAQYESYSSGNVVVVGGDLTNDNVIDILDFGAFIGQFGDTLPAPDDNWVGRHADLSGNGLVWTEDFSVIYAGFLTKGNPDITGASVATAAKTTGKTSVTVEELRRAGVRNAENADLNRDGMVDMSDVALFLRSRFGGR